MLARAGEDQRRELGRSERAGPEEVQVRLMPGPHPGFTPERLGFASNDHELTATVKVKNRMTGNWDLVPPLAWTASSGSNGYYDGQYTSLVNDAKHYVEPVTGLLDIRLEPRSSMGAARLSNLEVYAEGTTLDPEDLE